MAYKKITNKRTQPQLEKDKNGNTIISEYSFNKGATRRVLRAYMLYLVETCVHLDQHISFKEFYIEGVRRGFFPRNRALDLYVNNIKDSLYSVKEVKPKDTEE